MKTAFRFLIMVLLLAFGFQSRGLWAQQNEESEEAGTPRPRSLRMIGGRGAAVWRGHHGTARQTYAMTVSVGQLALYSGGVITSYNVRIQRDYPNRLRLELRTGNVVRVLIYDGSTVRAELPPVPTPAEVEIVLMLAVNSIEWIFGIIDAGAIFKQIREGVRPENFDPRVPRSVDVFELVLSNQIMLISANRLSDRIESVKYFLNRQESKIDFDDWRPGLLMQLPYRVTWQLNRQRRAELTLTQITASLR